MQDSFEKATVGLLENRVNLIDYLREKDVYCGIHYPYHGHLQKAFFQYSYGPNSFPKAEDSCRQEISLPLFPEITDAQIDKVASEVSLFFNGG